MTKSNVWLWDWVAEVGGGQDRKRSSKKQQARLLDGSFLWIMQSPKVMTRQIEGRKRVRQRLERMKGKLADDYKKQRQQVKWFNAMSFKRALEFSEEGGMMIWNWQKRTRAHHDYWFWGIWLIRLGSELILPDFKSFPLLPLQIWWELEVLDLNFNILLPFLQC